MGIGKHAEDLVERICVDAFFADLVVRGPKFKKANLAEKEVADVLVLHGQTILAFQVKAKRANESDSLSEDLEQRRVSRRIDEGIAQLKTTKRAFRSGRITSLTTVRGVTVPITSCESVVLVGVVVLDLVDDQLLPEPEQTTLYGGFTVAHEMPVHIFLRSDFEAVLDELTTTADFVRYLSARERAYGERRLMPAEELELLALYKTRPDIISRFLDGECDTLMIAPGSWDAYQRDHQADRAHRDLLNRPSRIIDDAISKLSNGLTNPPQGLDPIPCSTHAEGTVESYFLGVQELAGLSRLERRVLGERWLDKMRRADEKGDGYNLTLNGDGTGVLLMATRRSRDERRKGLYNLSLGAYFAQKLTKVIGLATENLSAPTRSYDLLVLDRIDLEDPCEREAVAGFGRGCFGPPRHSHSGEFVATKLDPVVALEGDHSESPSI